MRPRLTPYEAAQHAWAVEAELDGHSVAETIAHACAMSDLADAERTMRHHPTFISPPTEPRFVGWLRRRFGR